MAARKTSTLSDAWREKIQTSMLINRLQDHIESKVELSSTQVTAALGLLKKTAPDLSATTLSGDQENPIELRLAGLKDDLIKRAARFTAAVESAAVPRDSD